MLVAEELVVEEVVELVKVEVDVIVVDDVVLLVVEVEVVVIVVEQFATLVDPVVFVCPPFGQGVHDSASVAFDHVLSGHGVGAVEFSGQKFPAPHAIAGDEALVQYVPGRQGYEKFLTRSKLWEKPYKIRDEVTIGRPRAPGRTTELPKREKLDTRIKSKLDSS